MALKSYVYNPNINNPKIYITPEGTRMYNIKYSN